VASGQSDARRIKIGEPIMTLTELADKLDSLDVEVFASILGLEYTHDDQPEQVKKMIIDALRFSDQHGLKAPRPPLDDAD
jgi:hypothetical protein